MIHDWLHIACAGLGLPIAMCQRNAKGCCCFPGAMPGAGHSGELSCLDAHSFWSIHLIEKSETGHWLGVLDIGFKSSRDIGYWFQIVSGHWILVFESLWILDIESQPTTPIFRAVTLRQSPHSVVWRSPYSCNRGFGRGLSFVRTQRAFSMT